MFVFVSGYWACTLFGIFRCILPSESTNISTRRREQQIDNAETGGFKFVAPRIFLVAGIADVVVFVEVETLYQLLKIKEITFANRLLLSLYYNVLY